MSKIPKNFKKAITLLLAIVMLVSATNLMSVMAGQTDQNQYEALTELGQSVILGESGLEERDPRIQFLVYPKPGETEYKEGSSFIMELGAPDGKVVIPLGTSLEYDKTATETFYAELIERKQINLDKTEDLKNIIKYDQEKKEIELTFSEELFDIEPMAGYAKATNITMFLTPKAVGEIKIKAIHEEGYSNFVELNIKSAIRPFALIQNDFVSYDSTSLKANSPMVMPPSGAYSWDGSGAAAGYTQPFISIARPIEIKARFYDSGDDSGSVNSDFTNRKITIELNRGLTFIQGSPPPGMLINSSNGLWEASNTKLQTDAGAYYSDIQYSVNGAGTKTIVYTVRDNVQAVTLSFNTIGDVQQLASSYVAAAASKSALLTLNNPINVTTTRSRAATPSQIDPVDSATLNTLNVYGMPRTVAPNTSSRIIEKGQTDATGGYYVLGDNATKPFIGNNIVLEFLVPKELEITGITPITTGTLTGATFTSAAIPADTNNNLVTVNIPSLTLAQQGFYFNVSTSATATEGNYTIVPRSSRVDYPLMPNSSFTFVQGITYTITGPSTGKMTAYDANYIISTSTITNSNARLLDYPLGGFALKNNNATDINNHWVRMNFADTNINVRKVKFYSGNPGTISNVVMTLSDGSVSQPKDFPGPNNQTTKYFTISDFFSTSPSGASIRSITGQVSKLPILLEIGGGTARDNLLGYFSYYGTVDSSIAVDGGSFTATIETSGDQNFPTDSGDPNQAQTATTTTTISSSVAEKYYPTDYIPLLQRPSNTVNTTSNSTATFTLRSSNGSTFTGSYGATGNDALANLGNTANFIQGFEFYFKDIPGIATFDPSSFSITQVVNGVPQNQITNNITITRITDAADGVIRTHVQVPNVYAANINNSGFLLQFDYNVLRSARLSSTDIKQYIIGYPMNSAIVIPDAPFGVAGNGASATVLGIDNTNTFRRGISFGSPANILNVTANEGFVLSTAARINRDSNGWTTYVHEIGQLIGGGRSTGILYINPANDPEYRFQMFNNGDQPIPEFTAYIPLPKNGEWIVSEGNPLRPVAEIDYNPNMHIQGKIFDFSQYLDAEPYFDQTATTFGMLPNGAIDPTQLVIDYSDEYIVGAGGTWYSYIDIATGFAPITFRDVRTMRVRNLATAPIPPDASLTIILPINMGPVTEYDPRAGGLNEYSAIISSDRGGTALDLISEPVALRLRTGSASGEVFLDINGNGTKDNGFLGNMDPGMGGVTLRAYPTGQFDPNNVKDEAIATIVTNDGAYEFSGLLKTQNVDIVVFNPSNQSSLKFTLPNPSSGDVASDHSYAIFKNIVPSSTGSVNIRSALVPAINFSFNYDGAESLSPNPTSVAAISKFPGTTMTETEFPPLVMPYHNFNGWFTTPKTDSTSVGIEIKPAAAGTDIYDLYDEYLTNLDGTAFTADGTLYARYSPKLAKITVKHFTFINDKDSAVEFSSVETQNVEWGKTFAATKLTATELPGYTYNSAEPSDSIAIVNGDATINLYYKANSANVTIKHYTYQGTVGDATQVERTDLQQTIPSFVGSKITIAPLTITGHTYESAAPALPADKSFTVSATAANNVINLYYKANTYKVTFDTDNGVASTSANYIFGTKVTQPSNPIKTGHTFTGNWEYVGELVGGNKVNWNFTTDTMPAKDITLKALYTPIPYTITFDVNGGTALSPSTFTYDYGSLVAVPNLPQLTQRPGYTFKGWFRTNLDGSLGTQWNFATDKVDGNRTLTADWQRTIQKVTYTFDLNGGSYTGPAAHLIQQLLAGETVTEPTRASLLKPGHIFMDWYTDEDPFTTLWNFTTPVEHGYFKDTTLYARWAIDIANPMVVSFDLDGGTHNSSPSIASQNLLVGDKVTEPTESGMNKTGYTFDGWYIRKADGSLGNKWVFSTAITTETFGDFTLKAKWKINSYKVTFDPANGKATTSENYNFNSLVTKPNDPLREGYEFGKWLKEDSSEWNFNTERMPARDVLLTATWSIKSYKLTVDTDNGDPTTTQTVVYDTLATKPPLPTKVGYDFVDWYLLDSSGNVSSIWDFDNTRMPARDVTVKALWKIKTYTITVEHYTFREMSSPSTIALYKTETLTKEHFSTFTPTLLRILYHTYDNSVSDPTTITVTGAQTIKLYYKADVYTLDLNPKTMDFAVNDKYPTHKNNKPTWESVFAMLDAKTINSNDPQSSAVTVALKLVQVPITPPMSALFSPDYDSLDFSTITPGYTKLISVTAKWPNGDEDTKTIQVKISDLIAPEIINLPNNKKFYFESRKSGISSEQDLMDYFASQSISAVDNYDDFVPLKVSYLGANGFASINWSKDGEYVVYLDATDFSGNKAMRKAAIICIYDFDSGSSTGNGGGSGGGVNGGNNNSNNRPDSPSTNSPSMPNKPGGSTNNPGGGSLQGDSSTNGNYLDSNGNYVDKNGDIILDSRKVPSGATVNNKGQLMDVKGYLIDADGNPSGVLPLTGLSAIISAVPVIAILCIALVAFLKKKNNKI